MKLAALLKSGTAAFRKAKLYFGHGTDNAWDEAVWIALHILQEPLDASSELLERKLTREQERRIQALYDERIHTRRPVAYLIQEAWFAGLSFFVDERVLIPRSPMAELIAKKFKPFLTPSPSLKILDLCTGSACIAIACAKAFPEAQIEAADISPAALEVAAINIERHAVPQVKLHQSDLFDDLPDEQYDVIISNPPYVDEQDMKALPQEYRHEPTLALAAGKDGLLIVDRILQTAKNYLSEKGILIVEVGNSYLALQQHYPTLPFKWVSFSMGAAEVFVLSRKDLEKSLLILK